MVPRVLWYCRFMRLPHFISIMKSSFLSRYDDVSILLETFKFHAFQRLQALSFVSHSPRTTVVGRTASSDNLALEGPNSALDLFFFIHHDLFFFSLSLIIKIMPPSTQIGTQNLGGRMNASFFSSSPLETYQKAHWNNHVSFSAMPSGLGLLASLTENLQVSSSSQSHLNITARLTASPTPGQAAPLLCPFFSCYL